MNLTDEQEQSFKNATTCHICENPFDEYKSRINWDINMSMRSDYEIIAIGEYLGASHYMCNLQRNYQNYKIPVIIHNGKGYDSYDILL